MFSNSFEQHSVESRYYVTRVCLWFLHECTMHVYFYLKVYLSHSAVYGSVYCGADRPLAATMDMPGTLWKHSASLSLTAEDRQSTASVGSISPPFYTRLCQRPETFIHHLARLHVGCALIRNRSLANIILPSNVWGFERMFKC